MAESSEQPRKKLIIRFYLPESEKHEEGVCEKKNCSKPRPKWSTEYSSRVISKVCELKNKKGYYAATIWVNAENSSSMSECNEEGVDNTNKKDFKNKNEDLDNANKREFKNGNESSVNVNNTKFKNEKERVWKHNTNKRERSDSEIKNKQESVCKRNKSHTMVMDRSKKMQCWVILKRFMVSRDVWALKEPLLDKKSRSRLEEKMSLENIESNLNKFKYSKVDEFANDMRLVFSYALQYPPRSEIHKIARRMEATFELTWKAINYKWMHQDQ